MNCICKIVLPIISFNQLAGKLLSAQPNYVDLGYIIRQVLKTVQFNNLAKVIYAFYRTASEVDA